MYECMNRLMFKSHIYNMPLSKQIFPTHHTYFCCSKQPKHFFFIFSHLNPIHYSCLLTEFSSPIFYTMLPLCVGNLYGSATQMIAIPGGTQSANNKQQHICTNGQVPCGVWNSIFIHPEYWNTYNEQQQLIDSIIMLLHNVQWHTVHRKCDG